MIDNHRRRLRLALAHRPCKSAGPSHDRDHRGTNALFSRRLCDRADCGCNRHAGSCGRYDSLWRGGRVGRCGKSAVCRRGTGPAAAADGIADPDGGWRRRQLRGHRLRARQHRSARRDGHDHARMVARQGRPDGPPGRTGARRRGDRRACRWRPVRGSAARGRAGKAHPQRRADRHHVHSRRADRRCAALQLYHHHRRAGARRRDGICERGDGQARAARARADDPVLARGRGCSLGDHPGRCADRRGDPRWVRLCHHRAARGRADRDPGRCSAALPPAAADPCNDVRQLRPDFRRHRALLHHRRHDRAGRHAGG